MELTSSYTKAYTTIIAWSDNIQDKDLSSSGQRSFAAEELVDEYCLKVENLSQKEWKKLFHATTHYLNTVRT